MLCPRSENQGQRKQLCSIVAMVSIQVQQVPKVSTRVIVEHSELRSTIIQEKQDYEKVVKMFTYPYSTLPIHQRGLNKTPATMFHSRASGNFFNFYLLPTNLNSLFVLRHTDLITSTQARFTLSLVLCHLVTSAQMECPRSDLSQMENPKTIICFALGDFLSKEKF